MHGLVHADNKHVVATGAVLENSLVVLYVLSGFQQTQNVHHQVVLLGRDGQVLLSRISEVCMCACGRARVCV